MLEARVGIEPTHKGFADLSLTTWVPRPEIKVAPDAKKVHRGQQRCRTCKGPSSRGHQEPNRWSGRRDLNPRLRPWQGRTLPLSYSRSAAPIINEASERGKINAIATGKARGTHRPPPVRLLFCEPRRPGPLGVRSETFLLDSRVDPFSIAAAHPRGGPSTAGPVRAGRSRRRACE